MSLPTRLRLWTIVIIIAVIYLLTQFGVDLYTDYLWFQQLDLGSVFLTGLWAQVAVGLAVAIPVVAVFWLNVFIARWQSIRSVLFFSEEILVAQKFVVWLIWLVGLVVGWLVVLATSRDWLLILRFLNRQSFNLADPIFDRDIGFYIFSLPVYHFIQSWLVIALFLALLGAAAIYALAQQNNLAEGRFIVLPHAQLHLSLIGVFIFLTFALGHWLALFDLLYSARGVAFGASYTDVNVAMPALWVMIVIALVTALVLLTNVFLRRPAVSLLAIFVWIVVGLVGGGFVPGLVQRYSVEPNELASEAPYIENNIRFTNLAYGLDKVQERAFNQIVPLTPPVLADNEATFNNIRLWDYRPLQQTYQQIQAIRPYYRFLDIDLDRYTVNGQVRQVALSARELDTTQLQAPTWVTERLQFTHGYGVVVNPVSEITSDGLPQLWVKDLPPASSVDLEVTRPEIYHGEGTDDYVFVQTREREFNYPSGEQNVYANYEGTGGVKLDSYLKRLVFAMRLADVNMLLSQDFTADTRVMLHRNITERASQIAPFLHYDQDPYLIIGADGHLYWLLDAYTTSNLFPYAQPFGDLNYIRNSVKVLIDAYNGSITFYVVDPADPLIASYMAIFPSLFTPMSQMPDWLHAHLRYPEDLFNIQAKLYQTYHMRDVNVFYNKEDLWQTPVEAFAGGTTQPIEPHYLMLHLPGETQTEYALAQPFTPNNKDNLISWLVARSDPENYGQLVAYSFPKQELIFGPLQIEARIDQDPEISGQLTLWSQSGSQVIRGNLLVLPIDNALLYIEPLYLQAVNGQIPELRRVIVVSGNQVIMRETLAESLQALMMSQGPSLTSTETPTVTTETPTTTESPSLPAAEPLSQDVNQLAVTASNHYEAAQKALQKGDWATYGDELKKMKAALDGLVKLTSRE